MGGVSVRWSRAPDGLAWHSAWHCLIGRTDGPPRLGPAASVTTRPMTDNGAGPTARGGARWRGAARRAKAGVAIAARGPSAAECDCERASLRFEIARITHSGDCPRRVAALASHTHSSHGYGSAARSPWPRRRVSPFHAGGRVPSGIPLLATRARRGEQSQSPWVRRAVPTDGLRTLRPCLAGGTPRICPEPCSDDIGGHDKRHRRYPPFHDRRLPIGWDMRRTVR